MKVLLHACCAPCLIYPNQHLCERDFEVAAFFYNPNIHPYIEYKKRLDSLKEYANKENITVYYNEDYDIENYFDAINDNKEKPERCTACWRLRLKKTAQKAKELDFDAFTSTLLVSPYQSQKVIKDIGDSIAKEEGLEFYFEDFKPGFKLAQEKARELNLYRQKYCGCLYSERARYAKGYRRKE